jgi:chromosome segregation ATPase
MTAERHTELQDRLREVLGEQPAATLWGMLPTRDDLATKGDLSEMQNLLRGEISGVREELKGEITGVRDELKAEITGVRDELKGEMTGVRDELKGEVSDLRTDIATLRTEMEHRYATRDDVRAMADRFVDVMAGHVRTFIVVQAATVVGMSGILFGLLRFA